jgi:hypothetical protein
MSVEALSGMKADGRGRRCFLRQARDVRALNQGQARSNERGCRVGHSSDAVRGQLHALHDLRCQDAQTSQRASVLSGKYLLLAFI